MPSARSAGALGCHTRMRAGSPRRATIAGETLSDARMASEGPRATVIVQDKIAGDRPPRYGCQGRLCFNVARGPVPRHATRLKQDFQEYHD